MHCKRVSQDALDGNATVAICRCCYDAYRQCWSISCGHQMLLALARVVSTKVYLSSKGVDEAARRHAASRRQRFGDVSGAVAAL